MVYPVDYYVSKHFLLIANRKPITIFEESIYVLAGANSWPILVCTVIQWTLKILSTDIWRRLIWYMDISANVLNDLPSGNMLPNIAYYKIFLYLSISHIRATLIRDKNMKYSLPTKYIYDISKPIINDNTKIRKHSLCFNYL